MAGSLPVLVQAPVLPPGGSQVRATQAHRAWTAKLTVALAREVFEGGLRGGDSGGSPLRSLWLQSLATVRKAHDPVAVASVLMYELFRWQKERRKAVEELEERKEEREREARVVKEQARRAMQRKEEVYAEWQKKVGEKELREKKKKEEEEEEKKKEGDGEEEKADNDIGMGFDSDKAVDISGGVEEDKKPIKGNGAMWEVIERMIKGDVTLNKSFEAIKQYFPCNTRNGDSLGEFTMGQVEELAATKVEDPKLRAVLSGYNAGEISGNDLNRLCLSFDADFSQTDPPIAFENLMQIALFRCRFGDYRFVKDEVVGLKSAQGEYGFMYFPCKRDHRACFHLKTKEQRPLSKTDIINREVLNPDTKEECLGRFDFDANGVASFKLHGDDWKHPDNTIYWDPSIRYCASSPLHRTSVDFTKLLLQYRDVFYSECQFIFANSCGMNGLSYIKVPEYTGHPDKYKQTILQECDLSLFVGFLKRAETDVIKENEKVKFPLREMFHKLMEVYNLPNEVLSLERYLPCVMNAGTELQGMTGYLLEKKYQEDNAYTKPKEMCYSFIGIPPIRTNLTFVSTELKVNLQQCQKGMSASNITEDKLNFLTDSTIDFPCFVDHLSCFQMEGEAPMSREELVNRNIQYCKTKYPQLHLKNLNEFSRLPIEVKATKTIDETEIHWDKNIRYCLLRTTHDPPKTHDRLEDVFYFARCEIGLDRFAEGSSGDHLRRFGCPLKYSESIGPSNLLGNLKDGLVSKLLYMKLPSYVYSLHDLKDAICTKCGIVKPLDVLQKADCKNDNVKLVIKDKVSA
eukprot:Nk52_evm5s323 gene=Nk52_evmTU5s323